MKPIARARTSGHSGTACAILLSSLLAVPAAGATQSADVQRFIDEIAVAVRHRAPGHRGRTVRAAGRPGRTGPGCPDRRGGPPCE